MTVEEHAVEGAMDLRDLRDSLQDGNGEGDMDQPAAGKAGEQDVPTEPNI